MGMTDTEALLSIRDILRELGFKCAAEASVEIVVDTIRHNLGARTQADAGVAQIGAPALPATKTATWAHIEKASAALKAANAIDALLISGVASEGLKALRDVCLTEAEGHATNALTVFMGAP